MGNCEKVLEMAGATVHGIVYLGSYQGQWVAVVTHHGRKGIVIGSYGSCSHCDAIESILMDRNYDEEDDSTDMKLSQLGISYLKNLKPPHIGIAEAMSLYFDRDQDDEEKVKDLLSSHFPKEMEQFLASESKQKEEELWELKKIIRTEIRNVLKS